MHVPCTALTRRRARQTEVARASKGHVKALATSHKASRVLQSILKWGTPEQRSALVAEAAPELAALAKDAYGTHLVRKMIDTADKKELVLLTKSFKARCGGCVLRSTAWRTDARLSRAYRAR
jgi:hypothetical protein